MSDAVFAAWIQAGAALATFFAATAAVWATFKAPAKAAELAEELRKSNAKVEEERRAKLYILETLLRYRSSILHADSVAALNLIDIVFIDVVDVREAYQQFWNATSETTTAELKIERYNAIIEKIVRHLGMNDRIKASDIQRSYHPEGHAKVFQVQMAEVEKRWAELFHPDGTPRDQPGSENSKAQ